MQTTPKIKLTYFNGKGRTEPARLILAYAGVDYEDCRIEFQDWPKLKPSKIFSKILIWQTRIKDLVGEGNVFLDTSSLVFEKQKKMFWVALWQ